MIENDERLIEELDPALPDLTEQITQQLEAGDPINVAEYADRYPQCAGEIRKLLPTLRDLVNYGRAIDRDLHRRKQLINLDKEKHSVFRTDGGRP